MENCTFCELPEWKPEEVLARNAHAYVIIPRNAPGVNRLVIPRRHVEQLSELPSAELVALIVLVDQEKARLKAKTGGACLASWNDGEAAGQSECHPHIWLDDRQLGEPASRRGAATLHRDYNELSKACGEFLRAVELLGNPNPQ